MFETSAEQWGTDELLSSGVGNRAFTVNNSSSDTGCRLPYSPSHVLHLRHIPSDATEEVLSLALPFGKVTNILKLKGKRQAFSEMGTEETAVNVMNYYAPAAPLLHSQPLFIQYSNPGERRTDYLPDQARAEAMFHPVDTMQFESRAVTSASDAGDDPFPDVRCVLRIIVDNAFHHISLEMLHEVLSPFGPVLRIIIFTKYGKFQALAEYDNPRSAYCAKKILNGRNIFTSGCFIRVDYSKFTSLTIRYYSEKSRDFTRLDLASGDGQIYMDQPIAAAYGIQNDIVPSYTGAAGFTPDMSFSQDAGNLVPPLPAAIHSLAPPGQRTYSEFSENSVLLVSNLNPNAVTPDGLFILFGIYGNVHRVKIMFRTKEKALVQMADANQARLAISYLNGQKLYGRVLHATFSKHHTVLLLRGGQDDQGLTKDYSNSPLHRFKIPGSKNFQNIFPPSATLHLSNIPSCVTVDDMKNLFASTGYTVKACKFFRNDCRTALIQLGSVEEAVHALIELHNHDLGQNRTLRVSFSKYTI